MQEAALPLLSSWQNFYMIIGTAATLTGFMFIAATLMTGIEKHLATLYAGLEAFNSPTVVHFCTVLLLAVTLSAPWQTYWSISLLLGLAALGLVIYFLRVILRMRSVPGYQTPLRDWIWYSALPLVGYLAFIIAAFMLPTNPALALDLISGVMVLLLTIGIRNAWDLVTYLAVERTCPER